MDGTWSIHESFTFAVRMIALEIYEPGSRCSLIGIQCMRDLNESQMAGVIYCNKQEAIGHRIFL
jgi:hypothetical protein